MLRFGFIASSIVKKVTDTFSSIGLLSSYITQNGQMWNILRGTWTSTGSSAQSLDSGSSYPLASIPLGSYNQNISADVSSGTGVAFWVSDAGSWWAAASYNNTYQYQYQATCYGTNCSVTSYSCSGPCGYLVGGSPDTNNCGACYTYSSYPTCPYGGSLYFGSYCATSFSGSFPSSGYSPVYVSQPVFTGFGCAGLCGNATSGYDPYNCGPCTSCTPYAYSCTQTGTGTNYYLRLLKSVSGVVSSVTSDISLGSQAASLVVQTSGQNVSVSVYSDTAKTSQIGGSVSYIAQEQPTATSVGIIKIQSDHNQQSTVSNFSATI